FACDFAIAGIGRFDHLDRPQDVLPLQILARMNADLTTKSSAQVRRCESKPRSKLVHMRTCRLPQRPIEVLVGFAPEIVLLHREVVIGNALLLPRGMSQKM